jgi:acylphosphatase
MSDRIARHVIVLGRVQGVGYRAWAEREAQTRDLQGWVRNRHDGAVEAVFAGPAGVVQGMIEACRRGPSFARVERLDVSDAGDRDLALVRRGERFSVLSTA